MTMFSIVFAATIISITLGMISGYKQNSKTEETQNKTSVSYTESGL